MMMIRTKIKDILTSNYIGEVLVKGWVRTKRDNKEFSFISLNDGSIITNIQIVVEPTICDLKSITTGTCIAVKGLLVASKGSGQTVEILASNIEILGLSDPEKYPIQPKSHSLEFLRENLHLRMRTNTFSAIMRIRHHMSFAVHNFFNDKGFVYIQTPIITSSDAEGAGEMFRVSTLDPLKIDLTEEGKVDYSGDFFGKETHLTVSGQLEAELAATALGEVYTFGPTFRAENSNTTKHLAEFWMIEPEVCFNDLNDNIDLAEEFLKYLIKYALDNCLLDLKFLEERLTKEELDKPLVERSEKLIDKLNSILTTDFVRITYTEAIDILKSSKPFKKGQFKYPVSWGIDLQSEHERFLVEKHFKCPVVIINYPKSIKAFYMKQNIDNQTVSAMDVLFPNIGEIIGGSQREDDLDKLIIRASEVGINQKDIEWYLDTRRFGNCPHSGFGMGFERLMMFITGMTNIKDVIAFPRTPNNIGF